MTQTARSPVFGAGEALAAVELRPVSDPARDGAEQSVHVLTDQQAVQWLSDQPGGQIEITVTDLAAALGWSRSTLGRRIVEGLIARGPGKGRKSIFSLPSTLGTTAGVNAEATKPVDAAVGRNAGTTKRADATVSGSADATITPDAVTTAAPSSTTTQVALKFGRDTAAFGGLEPADTDQATPAPASCSAGRLRVLALNMALGLAMVGVSVLLFACGLLVNSWFGSTNGRSPDASRIYSDLSVGAELLAYLLPAVAYRLWESRFRGFAAVAWVFWIFAICYCLMAGIGFSSANIADTTAARAQSAEVNRSLSARIDRLKAERAIILETRSVQTIGAKIQIAQPKVDPAILKSTHNCTDVTTPTSGKGCEEVARLLEALGDARARDALDAELRQAETDMASRPAVTISDPQADSVVALLSGLIGGHISISQHDVEMARLVAFSLLPQFAGIALMLATALLGEAIEAIFAWLTFRIAGSD
jgi:hypothetical protein